MWRCVVIALACAGCTNPDDILGVQGTVTSVDSVEGQVVRLLRQTSQPLPSQPCTPAEPFKEMKTSADGEYGFEVFRLETRNTACFRIDATFPSGSVAWSEFGFYGATTKLPPLLDWRAEPSLDGGVLHFEPPVPWPDDLPPVQLGNVTHFGVQLTHHEQVVTADGGIIWEAEDRFLAPGASIYNPEYAREPLLMDELRLEDFEGTLTLTAALWDPDQPSTIDSPGGSATTMRAGQQLAVRGTRAPLSRGLPCPELASPCPLTDGELTEVDAGLLDTLVLTLPTPSNVAAVVLRGAWVGNGMLRVVLETADGGSTEAERVFRPDYSGRYLSRAPQGIFLPDAGFVTFTRAYAVISVDAGTPSSRVRLQFPAGLARIQEVSVFE